MMQMIYFNWLFYRQVLLKVYDFYLMNVKGFVFIYGIFIFYYYRGIMINLIYKVKGIFQYIIVVVEKWIISFFFLYIMMDFLVQFGKRDGNCLVEYKGIFFLLVLIKKILG